MCMHKYTSRRISAGCKNVMYPCDFIANIKQYANMILSGSEYILINHFPFGNNSKLICRVTNANCYLFYNFFIKI